MTFSLVKHNNNSISAITSAGQLASGKLVLIKEQTASSSSSISFVDGTSSVVLDNTYPIYLFKFINIHPATDSSSADAELLFQVDTGTNTNYNQAITSTYFRSQHEEGGSGGSVGYRTSGDQAQGTGFQKLAEGQGADNDQSLSGEMYLFNPSSTTFVKHFLSNVTYSHHGDYTMNAYVAGYVNTTTALTRIQFKMTNGNIDSGTIKLYGIKDS